MQFLAVTLLGLVVSGLWWLWVRQFENLYVAWAIWMVVCFGYAAIYDLRQAKRRRSIEVTKEPTQPIER